MGLSQSVDWQKASHWKLYQMRGKNGLRYSVDTLSNFKYINLNEDTIHYLLKDVQLWPLQEYSLWMGQFEVSCEDNTGITRKLEISKYGGFFFDDTSKRYYQVKEESRNNWNNYFQNQSAKFINFDQEQNIR